MTRKYFGTDGIRGAFGDALINPEFVMKLGWAVGKAVKTSERSRILIGKDTRISGYLLESALEAGIIAAGVDVELLGPMPTPGIAYLTQTLRAQTGIVISASHNPYDDNGIKFFSIDGCKLSDEIEAKIEELIDQPMQVVRSHQLGKARRIGDASGRYIEFCKSTLPARTRFNGMKIVVDCANGANYQVAPAVLQELGAEVHVIHNRPNGFNINEMSGSTHVESLVEAVINHKADLGIAFDGDGDRVILVDETGKVVDGDQILYVLAQNKLESSGSCPGIVGTVMSNMGLEYMFKELNIPFVRAKVGDRYVLEELTKRGWQLGGEPSGHIICLEQTTTGDGIISVLQVLYGMLMRQHSLSQLTSGMKVFPQIIENIATKNKQTLLENSDISNRVKEIEKTYPNKYRILLRPSGTEPLIRIMVEGEEADQVKEITAQLSALVKEVDEKMSS